MLEKPPLSLCTHISVKYLFFYLSFVSVAFSKGLKAAQPLADAIKDVVYKREKKKLQFHPLLVF